MLKSTSTLKPLPELTKYDSFRMPSNIASKNKPETILAFTNTRARTNRPNDPNIIGFGVYDHADTSNLGKNRMRKSHVRAFDQKRL